MLCKWIPPHGVLVLDVLGWRWPTLRVDCRLEANQKICLSSPRGGRDIQGDQAMAVIERVGAIRQMCVRVTDVFQVSNTWRTNISSSIILMVKMMLNLFHSMSSTSLSQKWIFGLTPFGQMFVGDVIACAELQLWVFNELQPRLLWHPWGNCCKCQQQCDPVVVKLERVLSFNFSDHRSMQWVKAETLIWNGSITFCSLFLLESKTWVSIRFPPRDDRSWWVTGHHLHYFLHFSEYANSCYRTLRQSWPQHKKSCCNICAQVVKLMFQQIQIISWAIMHHLVLLADGQSVHIMIIEFRAH